MPEPHFASADDDLPRTLRREREAREREARQRDISRFAPQLARDEMIYEDRGTGATVERLQIPFLHLMQFCFKAVFAAIPALILLTVLLWLGGQALSVFFPQLGKMQILIHFPK